MGDNTFVYRYRKRPLYMPYGGGFQSNTAVCRNHAKHAKRNHRNHCVGTSRKVTKIYSSSLHTLSIEIQRRRHTPNTIKHNQTGIDFALVFPEKCVFSTIAESSLYRRVFVYGRYKPRPKVARFFHATRGHV